MPRPWPAATSRGWSRRAARSTRGVKVNISAHVVGKIEKLYVKEGDSIAAGPAVSRPRARHLRGAARRIGGAVGDPALARAAGRARAARRRDQARARARPARARASPRTRQLEAAELGAELGPAGGWSRPARRCTQAQADLEKAQEDLTKTTIYAPLSGRVIALNAEEGEVVVSGTMNNPASVIGTIADLSEILAEVDVDETEMVLRRARPDREGHGRCPARQAPTTGAVVEIGSSGFTKPAQPDVTFFKVKVLLDAPDAAPAPGDVGARRDSTPPRARRPWWCRSRPWSSASRCRPNRPKDRRDRLLRARAKRSRWFSWSRPARPASARSSVGLSDETHAEISSGVEEGDVVVTGPYRTLKNLKDGDAVKISRVKEDRGRTKATPKPRPRSGDRLMALIEIRDITKVYDMGAEKVHALNGVDLEIERGEYVAIMGSSGCGKSTLMNLLGCLDTPSSGRLPPQRRRGRRASATTSWRRSATRRSASSSRPSTCWPAPTRCTTSSCRSSTPASAAQERRERARARARAGAASATACTTSPTSCRAASGSAWRSPARWSTSLRSCSPTSPPATSTRPPRRRSWRSSTSCTAAATR